MSASITDLKDRSQRATFHMLECSRRIDAIPIHQTRRSSIQLGHFRRLHKLYRTARREIERHERVAA